MLDVIRIPDEDLSPARAALNDHPVAIVRVRHLEHAVLARPEPGEPWRLEVAHDAGTLTLRGAAGLRASSKLLAATNRVGVTAEVIDAAARRVIEWSGAPRPTSLRHDAPEAVLIGFWGVLEVGWLDAVPPELRGALPPPAR